MMAINFSLLTCSFKYKTIASILFFYLANFSVTNEIMIYSITRTDYVKGIYKTFTYELKNDSIVVIRHSTNNLTSKILFSNSLSSKQKSDLYALLNSIELNQMKSEYTNSNVEGEGHSVYDIQINKQFKSILFYFGEEPHLKKLDDFIYELLPANHNDWYISKY